MNESTETKDLDGWAAEFLDDETGQWKPIGDFGEWVEGTMGPLWTAQAVLHELEEREREYKRAETEATVAELDGVEHRIGRISLSLSALDGGPDETMRVWALIIGCVGVHLAYSPYLEDCWRVTHVPSGYKIYDTLEKTVAVGVAKIAAGLLPRKGTLGVMPKGQSVDLAEVALRDYLMGRGGRTADVATD